MKIAVLGTGTVGRTIAARLAELAHDVTIGTRDPEVTRGQLLVATTSDLLARFDQTDRLVQLMWRPLCIAALNTPPERASAQVFLNVLRDSLGAKRAASDMLLPRADLPEAAPVAPAIPESSSAPPPYRYSVPSVITSGLMPV